MFCGLDIPCNLSCLSILRNVLMFYLSIENLRYTGIAIKLWFRFKFEKFDARWLRLIRGTLAFTQCLVYRMVNKCNSNTNVIWIQELSVTGLEKQCLKVVRGDALKVCIIQISWWCLESLYHSDLMLFVSCVLTSDKVHSYKIWTARKNTTVYIWQFVL